MMELHDAIDRACADVGIIVPRDWREGAWTKTDTLSGRNGKGDGRVIVDGERVTAWNWQTGEKATVHLKVDAPIDRKKIAIRREEDRRQKRQRAQEAAAVASRLMSTATIATHSYLARKGFPDERAPILTASQVSSIGGDYLVPAGAKSAILVPARIGRVLSSAQLIWEDGTKKFLAGGSMGGALHRIAQGGELWICEGFATGLTLRAALRSMNRRDGVVCGFSAHNLVDVAKSISGRAWIAADHDKPLDQFGGIGAGEHYARLSGRPYALPVSVGDDINDVHCRDGLFAVQRLLTRAIRKVAA